MTRHDFAQHVQQAEIGERTRLARVLPRERQQLLDKMCGAANPGAQILHGVPTRVVAGGAFKQLQLKMQGGKRRAQFMRRVGDERLLLRQSMPKPSKKTVERLHERLYFIRQTVIGQGLERARRARRAHG
ncbi:hypothetical protein GCM10027419_22820 [Pandoraea terrae]